MSLGVMAIEEYFSFPQAPEQEPHHQMQLSYIHNIRSGGSSVELQSAYSKAPTEWVDCYIVSGYYLQS